MERYGTNNRHQTAGAEYDYQANATAKMAAAAGLCDRAPGEITALTDAICEHLAILHKEIGDIEARFSAVLRAPEPQKTDVQPSPAPLLSPLGNRLMNALYGIDTAVERLRMLQDLVAL